MNKLGVYERQKKICLENRFLYDEMTKVGNVSFIQKLERRVGGGKAVLFLLLLIFIRVM